MNKHRNVHNHNILIMDDVHDDNLELSRFLYPRSDIEFMILKCVLEKHVYTFEDLLFWVAEYTVSYGLEQTWLMIRYIYGYSLLTFQYKNKCVNYFAKKHKKQSICTELLDEEQIPMELIDCVRTLKGAKHNLVVYTFIYLFTSLEEEDYATLRMFKETNQHTEKIKEFHKLHANEMSISEKKLDNIFESLSRKYFPNIVYYMKKLERHEWVLVFSAFSGVTRKFETKEEEIEAWALSAVDLIKYLLDIETPEKVPNMMFIKGGQSNLDVVNAYYNMDDKAEFLPLHKDVIRECRKTYNICFETWDEFIAYHTKSTLYWTSNKTKMHENKLEMLEKHRIRMSECSNAYVKRSQIPAWIITHDKTGDCERVASLFTGGWAAL